MSDTNSTKAKRIVTISEALRDWPGKYGRYYTPHLPQYPSYEDVYRLIKRAGVVTGRRGRCLTFDLDALIDWLAWQHDIQQLRRAGALLVY